MVSSAQPISFHFHTQKNLYLGNTRIKPNLVSFFNALKLLRRASIDVRRLSKEYRRSNPRNQTVDSFLYKVESLIRGLSSLLLCFLIFGDLSLFRHRYINSGRGFILIQYS